MRFDDLVISRGSTFLITDLRGNIDPQTYRGLVFQDTRHLSRYQLFIDNKFPDVLTSKATDFNQSATYLTNSVSEHLDPEALSICRKRLIGEMLTETIRIGNNTQNRLDFKVEFALSADFADLFELKYCANLDYCQIPINREVRQVVSKNVQAIVFSYSKGIFKRETAIRFDKPFQQKDMRLLFGLALKPKATWDLHVELVFTDKAYPERKVMFFSNNPQTVRSRTIDDWKWSVPKLETDWDELRHLYTQSILDLAALRFYQKDPGGNEIDLPAAGMPWFMTIFGRDSLITAYQTLFLGQDLARGTLRTLSKFQGKVIDAFREEEPGKILHEMRFGEVAALGKWVGFPYYGSADATPLFLILLAEFYRWTGDKEFVAERKQAVLSALTWIDVYGDADRDGFVEYSKKNPAGLDNQNWRDSPGSMVFLNGEMAVPPIASADIQGYVHDAKLRMAELAEEVWGEKTLAEKLRQEAKELKKKFNKMFWLAEKGYFALGLDKDKSPIDSPASSMGHLLWSGIVDEDKVSSVAKSLFAPELYSGWGVRTLGTNSLGYNPVRYHQGTVWPHDNSLIAAGLSQAKQKKEMLAIIEDMTAAGEYFNYRLPEVFAGYAKDENLFPVQYPTAASPQAWAAGTVVLFLSLLLGIQADRANKTLQIDPVLPKNINFIRLNGVSAFGKHFLIEVTREKSVVREVEEWECHFCGEQSDKEHRH